MQWSRSSIAELGFAPVRSKPLQVTELIGVFVVGIATVTGLMTLFGSGVVASVSSIWVANLLMLGVVYWGLRRRGQDWAHLGLKLGRPDMKTLGITFLQSVPVFILAVSAFVAGAVLMANLVGMPEAADMSKYDYLRGNLMLTILALGSVYVVSALAEEVIYRGFLITRICELVGNRKWASCLAVVVSSLIFGLVHSDWGLAGMVQASCMGMALSASFLAVRRNLWVVILAHAYMDTILLLQMYLA